VEHWRRGDHGGEAVEYGHRGIRGYLKKVAQNVIDNRRSGLHFRWTLTFGLFIRDVIVAAGGHVVLKSCHAIQPSKT
jgi:hypothetical protein